MSENAENEGKVAKKATKKSGAKKPAKKTARKVPAKKRPVKKVAAKKTAEAAPAAKKRGRPAGKKAAAKRPTNGRRKKVKQFAYMLLTPQEGGELKAGTINGPFASEKDALDDASIMADDSMTVVLFREAKRGKVQKSTKFVAGR